MSETIKKPLKEYLEDANQAASRASEILRNLGFGAIAVIWIFKNPDTSKNLLPDRMLSWALLFAVISLSFDLFQYVFSAITLYHFYEGKEKLYDDKKLSEEQISDVQCPEYIRYGADFFWWSKLGAIIVCYIIISSFLIAKL
jgi:hypothetical protein